MLRSDIGNIKYEIIQTLDKCSNEYIFNILVLLVQKYQIGGRFFAHEDNQKIVRIQNLNINSFYKKHNSQDIYEISIPRYFIENELCNIEDILQDCAISTKFWVLVELVEHYQSIKRFGNKEQYWDVINICPKNYY